MAKLIILGSSNAVPTLEHENTHFAVVTESRAVLVDCGSNPLVRLQQAGVDIAAITDVILTHFHPDHVSGLPLLLMDLWLMGRRNPLNIYGLHYTIDRAVKMMNLYDWEEWPNFFMVNFCRIPPNEMFLVMDAPDLRLYSSPVKHFLPSFGLRFEFKAEEKSLAYSCDTEACPAVVKLAQGVDVLIHEASGPFRGHSSASQAGEVARQAEAKALYLIHYPTGRFASGDIVAEARSSFPGTVVKAEDFMQVNFG